MCDSRRIFLDQSPIVVITSINPPNKATLAFSRISPNPIIVVGDTKSPASYEQENTIFISMEAQEEVGFRISSSLPKNHYSRKMVGYLEGISRGATHIVDTDDDNIPSDDFFPKMFGERYLQTKGNLGFINVYSLFTDEQVWPRGLPLQNIMDDYPNNLFDTSQEQSVVPAIIQGLANLEPDVDAIFRLTQNRPIHFRDSPAIVLGSGTWSPFNSQNTLFPKDLFTLLYLPTTVTFRYTDILRSYIAQPIMWRLGFGLAFIAPTVTQERNPHDYFKDYVSEVPMYLTAVRVCELAAEEATKSDSISDYMRRIYSRLVVEEVVKTEELSTLEDWIADLNDLGVHQ
jgi:hypothetical protein